MNPYYEVIYPKVDKNKPMELAHMVAGGPVPKGASSITKKPVLRLRRLGGGGMNANANRNVNGNVYGNNTNNWRTLSASSSMSRPSLGDIAVRNRREKETKTALRELGRMVRGY
jgi:hypothetical protein